MDNGFSMLEKLIKKILILLLIILPVYFTVSLYNLDKYCFLFPVDSPAGVIIRNDSRGDGFFSAKRNGGRRHEGVDFLAPIGTRVLAARSGQVILSRVVSDTKKKSGSGNYIIIRHSQGISSVYAHLEKVFVKYGEFVRQGDLIGLVGKTGNANYPDIQPHLHFEIRNKRTAEDPMAYIE